MVILGNVFYKPPVRGRIGISFDYLQDPQVRKALDELHEKPGMLRIEIRKATKPITRGARSQMNWIHGECSAIADQLSDENTMYTTEEIKAAMKRMAVERGFPTKMSADATEQPLSLKEVSSIEAGMVIDTILDFAYNHKLYLYEYDEKGKAHKTVQGKAVYDTRRTYDK